MSRSPDRAKERRWVRLFQEKRSSGESVAAFCRKRRIPVHQFYWWQRQLRHHGSQDAGEAEVVAGCVCTGPSLTSFADDRNRSSRRLDRPRRRRC